MSERAKQKPGTLGSLLYSTLGRPVPEQDWVALVQRTAARDQGALQALYERAHRLVFTLALRINGNRETAEEVTIDVFHDVWLRAPQYDPVDGSVLGWIMNLARSRAIDRVRFDRRKKRTQTAEDQQPEIPSGNDPTQEIERREQATSLRAALAALTPVERRAIEITYFSGLTHVEAAARLNEPLGTIKTRIRSGLLKMRQALQDRAGNA